MIPRMRKLCAECRGYESRGCLRNDVDDASHGQAINEENTSSMHQKQWEERRLAEMRVRQAHKNAKKARSSFVLIDFS